MFKVKKERKQIKYNDFDWSFPLGFLLLSPPSHSHLDSIPVTLVEKKKKNVKSL